MNSDAVEPLHDTTKNHLRKGVYAMKKTLLIVLALCVVLLVSACSTAKPPADSTTASTTVPETTAVPDTTAADTTADAQDTTVADSTDEPITTQGKLEISGEGFREWMDNFMKQERFATQVPNEDPAEVVRSYIEGLKDADYTISITFVKGEVDPEGTQRAVAMYDGSELAAANCWGNAWIAEHFTAVYAEYDAEYDHEKTFLPDGALAQHFFLIRDPDTMLWYIWDATASTERP